MDHIYIRYRAFVSTSNFCVKFQWSQRNALELFSAMAQCQTLMLTLEVHLHEPSASPCPSLSKFYIAFMLTDHLMDRMGSRPILSVKQSVHIGTLITLTEPVSGTTAERR